MAEVSLVTMPSNECQRILLVINQYWFREYGLARSISQSLPRTDIYHHMTSLDHNALLVTVIYALVSAMRRPTHSQNASWHGRHQIVKAPQTTANSLFGLRGHTSSLICIDNLRWTESALVQIMACRLFGANPLPEPMLAHCQMDPWEQISVKFESEFYHFHSRKWICKCRLPKWWPFCPGGH